MGGSERLNGSTWSSTWIRNEALPGLTLFMLSDMQTQLMAISYREWRSLGIKMKVMGTSRATRKGHHGRDMA